MGYTHRSFWLQNISLPHILQDAVGKHSATPLNDPNFDFEAWKNKHLKRTEEVADKWVQDVKAKYGSSESVKFACVGYW